MENLISPSILVGTPKPGFGRKRFPKAYFEPTGLVFPEEERQILKGVGKEGVNPPGFYGDGTKFGSPEGVKALKLQQWRTDEKNNGRRVGSRGGYSHMNPSREEGKKEPKWGLGVTTRVRGRIIHCLEARSTAMRHNNKPE